MPAIMSRSGDEMASVHVLWTGGFDSTWLLIDLLAKGRSVQPVYMRHSDGAAKVPMETAAQFRILDYLGRPAAIRDAIVWDFEQLGSVGASKPLLRALNELADSMYVSHQYSALRFCRDVTGLEAPLLLGIVRYDELWERLVVAGTEHGPLSSSVAVRRREREAKDIDSFVSAARASATPPIWRFFDGFELPLFFQTKREIWDAASPRDREVLKLTFSCEEADGQLRSCVDRKVDFHRRCTPCKRRLEDAA